MAMRALLAGACAASIACAAHAQRANPILAPEQPWGFHGFSLRPPAGTGWYSLAKSRTGAAFGRRIESQTHTLVGAVHSAREARPFASPETLAAELRARRARNLDPARFRLLEVDERRDDLDGAWCTRYRLDEERVAEERLLVLHPGAFVRDSAAPDLLVDLSIPSAGFRRDRRTRAHRPARSWTACASSRSTAPPACSKPRTGPKTVRRRSPRGGWRRSPHRATPPQPCGWRVPMTAGGACPRMPHGPSVCIDSRRLQERSTRSTTWGSSTTRRAAARATSMRRCAGSCARPISAMRRRSSTSGSCSTRATACRSITPSARVDWCLRRTTATRAKDLLHALEFGARPRDGLSVEPTVLIDPP
jgi:hypothetical protein